tara:strand:- start:27687 stop:28451 length:765 start_codon:yes stop_codon:yes gene_type:complete
MGLTERELTQLVESGQLASDEFLRNFIPALNQTAVESGALAASLETSRVAMQRFGTAVQLNILEAFDAGAEGGLADFFNNLSATINQLSPAFRFIGRIAGTVLSGLSTAIRAISQVARPVLNVFEQLFGSTIRDGNGELQRTAGALEGLIRLAERFAGAILLPFALLEQLNDRFSTQSLSQTTGLDQQALSGGFRDLLTRGPIAGISTLVRGQLRAPETPVAQVNIVANEEGRTLELINEALQGDYTVNYEVSN